MDRKSSKGGCQKAMAKKAWKITDDFPCKFPVSAIEIALLLKELPEDLLKRFHEPELYGIMDTETQEESSL